MPSKAHWEQVYARKPATGPHAQFDAAFSQLRQECGEHHTPTGGVQTFICCDCRLAAS
jgi:hypothetical protein